MRLRTASSASAVMPGAGQSLGVEGLLYVLARLAARPPAEMTRLAETLLHCPRLRASQPWGRSDLNGNGSPLQVLLSARHDRWVTRLIGDPAFYRRDPLTRLTDSLAALEATLRLGGAPGMRAAARHSVDDIVPRTAHERRRYPTGMIRLAASATMPGAAVYVSPGPAGAAWTSARRWTTAVLPAPLDALRLIDTLAPRATLFGVGLEGVSAVRGRAKLYWRLSDTVSPASFALPMVDATNILAFLRAMIGDRDLPANAFTFSAGFSLETGRIADIKVDVCNHTVGLSLADALVLVNAQADALRLAPPPLVDVHPLLAGNGVSVGCLGVGVDQAGRHRLNVYLYQSSTRRHGRDA